MPDPVASLITSAVSLATFITNQLKEHAPDFLQGLKDKGVLKKATHEYLSRYQDAYGTLRPIGLTNPIPLNKIYTEVQFTTENLRHYFSAKGLEQVALRDLRLFLGGEELKTLNGITAANQFQRLLVIGHPGGGKSTYLRRIGWECLRAHNVATQGYSGFPAYTHTLLPVLLELKSFRSDTRGSLIELLARELANCGFPDSPFMIQGMLKAGKLLILLDALDEIAQDRVPFVVKETIELTRRYPKCRFIISCREAFQHDYFKDFQDVTLLDFTDGQIASFIYNWFSSPGQRADKIAETFLQQLHSPEHAATLELARSPVLLGYLCVSYQGALTLSTNRAEVYRRALDIYLLEWNAREQKMAHAQAPHASLPHETELAMLAQIAYEALKAERFFLTKDEWLRGIRQFMTDLVDKPKGLSTEDILTRIAVSQGLVVQRTHQDWSFSHLTLQEYLAAYHIDENSLIEHTINAHLEDERWREVFRILAGIRPGPLLLAMIRSSNAKVVKLEPEWHRWLALFRTWGNSEDFPDKLEPLVVMKAAGIGIFLAFTRFLSKDIAPCGPLHARARDLALSLSRTAVLTPPPTIARFLSNDLSPAFALDLAVILEEYITQFNRSAQEAKPPVKGFAPASLGALAPLIKERRNAQDPDLSARLLNSARLPHFQNPEAVVQYFNSLHLILACKKAAARTLKEKEWRQVLDQML